MSLIVVTKNGTCLECEPAGLESRFTFRPPGLKRRLMRCRKLQISYSHFVPHTSHHTGSCYQKNSLSMPHGRSYARDSPLHWCISRVQAMSPNDSDWILCRIGDLMELWLSAGNDWLNEERTTFSALFPRVHS
jgi:hypothetical protein